MVQKGNHSDDMTVKENLMLTTFTDAAFNNSAYTE